MPDDTTDFKKQCEALRLDIKAWEIKHAAANNGAKPSRSDIKARPEMAQKYKEYQKLRGLLQNKSLKKSSSKPFQKLKITKIVPEMPPPLSPTKRSSRSIMTPSKSRTRLFATPTSNRIAPPDFMTPRSPALPTVIGPTPQRDGRVLGLFDLLSDSENVKSPTKSTELTTPTKRKLEETGDELFTRGRTPMSASKRQLLNYFMTPTKRTPGGSEMIFEDLRTPKSASMAKDFATPAFLKRRTQMVAAYEGGADVVSPVKRVGRAQFTRSLSSIITGLKGQMSEQYDDDEEALREIENEGPTAEREKGTNKKTGARGLSDFPDLPARKKLGAVEESEEVVGDSQSVMRFLSGFDDEGKFDKEDSGEKEVVIDRGRPMRQFKKKMPKRTTRKVNIKPTVYKRLEMPKDGGVEGGEDGDDREKVIEETQLFDGDDKYEDVQDENGEPEERNRKKGATAAKGKGKGKGKKMEDGDKEAPKKARKVNELAHTNFKRMKLRNYGAKGGPGYNSRFRRRR